MIGVLLYLALVSSPAQNVNVGSWIIGWRSLATSGGMDYIRIGTGDCKYMMSINGGLETCVRVEPEPTDASAIVIGASLGYRCNDAGVCIDGMVPVYSCADKSRILLTAEDGTKHCIKF